MRSQFAAAPFAEGYCAGHRAAVLTLRRRRWTMASIAVELRLSRATVSRVLARAGLSRLAALDPAPLPHRYERARPGELLHIDSKKLACIQRAGHRVTGDPRDHVRGAGWEAAFVAIDDRSRVAFAEMFADERKPSAAAFLDHAARYYATLGVRVRCIMTDNAKVFRSLPFIAACRRWRLRHIFTRIYTPRTNGKAERFIQTALREWAYGRTYRHSRERTAYLSEWLHRYNWHRPHSASHSVSDARPMSQSGCSCCRITGRLPNDRVPPGLPRWPDAR